MINSQVCQVLRPETIVERKHYPGAATAAIITIAAVADNRHILHAVQWSYSAAPTGGRLTVEDGAGTVIFDVDITAAGPNELKPFITGSINTAMVITLASGAGAVVGKLNAQTVTYPS